MGGNRRERQTLSDCILSVKPIKPYLARFIRWLFKAEDIQLEDPEDAWNLLVTMGRGAGRGTNAARILSYEEAEAACVHIRGLSAASGAPYAVDDLVCFCCSATHAEATLRLPLPAAATPVTIEWDLGSFLSSCLLESPSILAEPQSLTRFRRKATPRATMSSVLVTVLHELLVYVTGVGAASLCHSSRALHAGGMYMTRRNRQKKHRILRSVEGLLYNKLPDMILEGVGRSLLLRTQALACDFHRFLQWLVGR